MSRWPRDVKVLSFKHGSWDVEIHHIYIKTSLKQTDQQFVSIFESTYNIFFTYQCHLSFQTHSLPLVFVSGLGSEIPRQIHETSGWLHLHPDSQPDENSEATNMTIEQQPFWRCIYCNPRKMNECPLKRDHVFKGTFTVIFQPSIFRGQPLVFSGGVSPIKNADFPASHVSLLEGNGLYK